MSFKNPYTLRSRKRAFTRDLAPTPSSPNGAPRVDQVPVILSNKGHIDPRRVEEDAWSPEAREAAARARKQNAKGASSKSYEAARKKLRGLITYGGKPVELPSHAVATKRLSGTAMRRSLKGEGQDNAQSTIPAYLGPFNAGKEVAGVTSVSGTPGYGPTEGGAAPEGLLSQSVGSWPHENNRYSFHVAATDAANEIVRYDRQSPGQPAQRVASFDHPVWMAQDATAYHAFRKPTSPVDVARTVTQAQDTLQRIARGAPANVQAAQARAFRAMSTPSVDAAMNPQRRTSTGFPSIADINARASAYWKDKGGKS